jgi:hypothetical protein
MKTDTWDDRLAEQVRRKFENYQVQRIALDNALVNKEIIAAGDVIYVAAVSSSSAAASIRLNKSTNDLIPLEQKTRIRTVFTRLYVSCDAQAGEWIDVLLGINFDIEQMPDLELSDDEAQPVVVFTDAVGGQNVVCEAHSCSNVLLRANPANVGLVWINWGAAAGVNSCHVLEPGEIISVRLSNTNRINGWFVAAGDQVFVTYEA